MNNIDKIKNIEKTLDKHGELIVSFWILRKNSWIYTFRNTEEYNKTIMNLLNKNNIDYVIKSNMVGEMLVLA